MSKYASLGVRTPGAGANVVAYAGVGVGLTHGVWDWDGYFITLEGEIGLPFLKDVISLNPAVFISGVDGR